MTDWIMMKRNQTLHTIVNDSCRTKGSKNREFLVDGDVLKDDSRLASIRWWIIINKDQQYKVIDLTLAGVSLRSKKKTSLHLSF